MPLLAGTGILLGFNLKIKPEKQALGGLNKQAIWVGFGKQGSKLKTRAHVLVLKVIA
jgi:hypothetical protein